MSYIGNNGNTAGNGRTDCRVIHALAPGPYTGHRTVITVITEATQTITSILEEPTLVDGGFTARGSHAAHGKKLWLFDKICGVAEPNEYKVNFTPAVVTPPQRATVLVRIIDFAVSGGAIVAYEFADSATGTTVTLPSIEAIGGEDIFTLVWCDPLTADGYPIPQSPLINLGAFISGMNIHMGMGRQAWNSSSPTGTRSHTVASGTYADAIGVIMLIGGTPVSVGGWGVGMVRMGAN